ncbi:MAG TPA: AI-2E family transporter [Steroidobacteraceae bacterium]|jgi:predicted PurR-regulated permease PerM|nr:AI-2E family transporter [Steroidobacteraceae bacterium]
MYSRFYRRCFAIATVVILGYALLKMLAPFWGPLGWAAFLAFFLLPVQKRLTRRFGGRRAWAALLITALTPFVLFLPLSALGIVFAKQVGILIDYLRAHSIPSFPTIREDLDRYPVIGPLLRWVDADVSLTAAQVQEWLVNGAQSLLKSAAAVGEQLAIGVFGTVIGFALMVFLLFFLLRDGERIFNRVMKLVPLEPKRRARLIHYLAEVTRAVVYGHSLTALAQGALMGVGFAIARLPSPVVFGVLAALAALLPGAGTGFVAIPAVLYLAFAGRWAAAVFLGIWSVGIALCDNLLRPYLTRQHAAVSTLVVFVGVIGGVVAFGLIGLVLGPVLLSLMVALVRFAEEGVQSSDEGPPRA